MAESKTKATQSSPSAYVAAIVDESRRRDCEVLLALMAKSSKHPAVMWGTAIVGFGAHKYALAGGRQGESPHTIGLRPQGGGNHRKLV